MIGNMPFNGSPHSTEREFSLNSLQYNGIMPRNNYLSTTLIAPFDGYMFLPGRILMAPSFANITPLSAPIPVCSNPEFAECIVGEPSLTRMPDIFYQPNENREKIEETKEEEIFNKEYTFFKGHTCARTNPFSIYDENLNKFKETIMKLSENVVILINLRGFLINKELKLYHQKTQKSAFRSWGDLISEKMLSHNYIIENFKIDYNEFLYCLYFILSSSDKVKIKFYIADLHTEIAKAYFNNIINSLSKDYKLNAYNIFTFDGGIINCHDPERSSDMKFVYKDKTIEIENLKLKHLFIEKINSIRDLLLKINGEFQEVIEEDYYLDESEDGAFFLNSSEDESALSEMEEESNSSEEESPLSEMEKAPSFFNSSKQKYGARNNSNFDPKEEIAVYVLAYLKQKT